jgi:hypothetical protein
MVVEKLILVNSVSHFRGEVQGAFISESASSVNHLRNLGVRSGELPGFLLYAMIK